MLPRMWHHLFKRSYDLPARPADTPAPSPANRDGERVSLWDDEDPDLVEVRVVAERTGTPTAKSPTHFTDKVTSEKERFRPGLFIQIP
jgi:hypothetical protein